MRLRLPSPTFSRSPARDDEYHAPPARAQVAFHEGSDMKARHDNKKMEIIKLFNFASQARAHLFHVLPACSTLPRRRVVPPVVQRMCR